VKKHILNALAICCFINPVLGAPSLAATYDNPNARDILILTKWFEGEFDSSEQVWFEKFDAAKVPEDRRVERLHAWNKRLDLPEFGDHVFYVEEYMNNDPEEIVRQRFVVFEPDLQESSIRMKQGFFKNAKKVLGGKNLDRIKAKDIFFIDTCDVFWKRKAGQFEGKMKAKECVFGEGELRRYSVHDLTLSENEFWRTDSTYLVSDGSFYKGNLAGFPTKMRKADRFVCDVSFKPENTDGMSFTEVREKTENVHGKSIHSEGGTFVATRSYDGQEFEYLMREKEYPFYSERPNFIYFSMRKKGDPYSIAYTVSDLNSRRIGGQFGDYGFQCHREGYTFNQSLELLDNQ